MTDRSVDDHRLATPEAASACTAFHTEDRRCFPVDRSLQISTLVPSIADGQSGSFIMVHVAGSRMLPFAGDGDSLGNPEVAGTITSARDSPSPKTENTTFSLSRTAGSLPIILRWS